MLVTKAIAVTHNDASFLHHKSFAWTNLTLLFMVAICLCLTSNAYAQSQTRDATAAQCREYFARLIDRNDNSITSMRDLANDPNATVAFARCVDYGIDPPLAARPNFGRSGRGAPTATRANIPSKTCSPMESCHYASRVSRGEGSLNNPTSGESYVIGSRPGRYSAPQIGSEPLPSSAMPDHLEHGGTIYIYGTGCAIFPTTSLISPGASSEGGEVYSTGSQHCFTEGGHIMLPTPANGNVLSENNKVTLTNSAIMNWDFSGFIRLPARFSGTVGGNTYNGGEFIFINHSQDFWVPAGTELYTLPNGYDFPVNGYPVNEYPENTPPIEYAPYDGAELALPAGFRYMGVDQNYPDPGNQPPGTEPWGSFPPSAYGRLD